MKRGSILLALFLLGITMFDSNALARPDPGGPRVALVIGNETYQYVTPAYLGTPVKDAIDMAAQLKLLGFDVTNKGTNLGVKEMNDLIDAFVQKAKNADIAIVYYSGHGVQYKGVNYLIPTDFEDPSRPNVIYSRDACSVDELRSRLVGDNITSTVFILDACRSDPKIANATKSISDATGLAYMPVNPGGVIGFACQPGKTALGSYKGGSNSVYTACLLNNLAAVVPLSTVFHRVNDDVATITSDSPDGEQEPQEWDDIRVDELLLATPARTVAVVTKSLEPRKSEELDRSSVTEEVIRLPRNTMDQRDSGNPRQAESNSSSERMQEVESVRYTTTPASQALKPLVLIYPPADAPRSVAEKFSSALTGDDYNVLPIPYHTTGKPPETTEIRFYRFPEDESEALKVQAELKDIYPTLKSRISYVIDPDISTPRYYEVHFGKDAAFPQN